MNKVKLFLSNIWLASRNLALSLLNLYKYHQSDGYVKNVLVVLDCFGNTLALGDPYETISSRSGKAQVYEQEQTPPRWGVGCRLCSFLAIFQQDHCTKALERNRGRRAIVADES